MKKDYQTVPTLWNEHQIQLSKTGSRKVRLKGGVRENESFCENIHLWLDSLTSERGEEIQFKAEKNFASNLAAVQSIISKLNSTVQWLCSSSTIYTELLPALFPGIKVLC